MSISEAMARISRIPGPLLKTDILQLQKKTLTRDGQEWTA